MHAFESHDISAFVSVNLVALARPPTTTSGGLGLVTRHPSSSFRARANEGTVALRLRCNFLLLVDSRQPLALDLKAVSPASASLGCVKALPRMFKAWDLAAAFAICVFSLHFRPASAAIVNQPAVPSIYAVDITIDPSYKPKVYAPSASMYISRCASNALSSMCHSWRSGNEATVCLTHFISMCLQSWTAATGHSTI